MSLVKSAPLIVSALSLLSAQATAENSILDAPTVTLANTFHDEVRVQDYWMSEKLDGIRAIWNGKQLQTRSGKIIRAPSWFIKALPAFAVEGELWAGRGEFATVQKTVLDQEPEEKEWKKIRFMLFDALEPEQSYQARYQTLRQFISGNETKNIGLIEQLEIQSKQALFNYFARIEELGGEGVMLREIQSNYFPGRSDHLLKLKQIEDTEVRVIGYKQGKGKYAEMVGALHVELSDGRKMFVGSGLTDALRQNPPAIGAVVTIQYSGFTSKGLPRFARYHRERTPE